MKCEVTNLKIPANKFFSEMLPNAKIKVVFTLVSIFETISNCRGIYKGAKIQAQKKQ